MTDKLKGSPVSYMYFSHIQQVNENVIMSKKFLWQKLNLNTVGRWPAGQPIIKHEYC